MLHLLRSYWNLAGGNVAAMPLEAAVATLGAVIFRKTLRRLGGWARRKILGPVDRRLDEIHATARAAHRISAATHKHITGEDHPAAPREGM